MKNLLMIAIAFITITATAQDRKQKMHKDGDKDKMAMHKDMSPEERAELQTKKMTLRLDLNENQQAEVKKMLLDDTTARQAKMAEYKAKRDKAEGEKPSKEDRLKMQNEYLDRQIAMKKKMKAILNTEQYEKFEKIMERKEMKGKRGAMKKQHLSKDSDHKE